MYSYGAIQPGTLTNEAGAEVDRGSGETGSVGPDEAAAQPMCIKSQRRSGWLRLAYATAIPYFLVSVAIMALQVYSHLLVVATPRVATPRVATPRVATSSHLLAPEPNCGEESPLLSPSSKAPH